MNKLIVSIILTAIITAGLAGGGVYWWQQHELNSMEQKCSSEFKTLSEKTICLKEETPTSPTSQEQKNIQEDSLEIEDYPLLSNLPNLICSPTLEEEIARGKNEKYYYWLKVNGCNYTAEKEEITEYYIGKCLDTLDAELESNKYNIINGCFYGNGERMSTFNLLAEVSLEKPEGQKGLGEGANEWFRFKDGDNLHIYLSGGAGCAGCFFIGPYLVVNTKTEEYKLHFADLPNWLGWGYLVFTSPDGKQAIEVVLGGNNEKNIQLHLYDFKTNQRLKRVYTIPNDAAILSYGHGLYLTVDNAINWIDNNTIEVQLYERDDKNLESDYVVRAIYGQEEPKYFKLGEPIKITIE
ncbi:hypothetical protein KKA15_06505 [Patescibacteria group bacterium]|nr:hypothetical protein [Patescibacteria group bacterium]